MVMVVYVMVVQHFLLMVYFVYQVGKMYFNVDARIKKTVMLIRVPLCILFFTVNAVLCTQWSIRYSEPI